MTRAVAVTPTKASVAANTRRYSSTPAPMIRGERARYMDKNPIHVAAMVNETAV